MQKQSPLDISFSLPQTELLGKQKKRKPEKPVRNIKKRKERSRKRG